MKPSQVYQIAQGLPERFSDETPVAFSYSLIKDAYLKQNLKSLKPTRRRSVRDEHGKKSLLIAFAQQYYSSKVSDCFKDLDEESRRKLEVVAAQLEECCLVHICVLIFRILFHNRTKLEDETLTEYLMSLDTIARFCEFEPEEKDGKVKEQFFKNCEDEETIQVCLSRLEKMKVRQILSFIWRIEDKPENGQSQSNGKIVVTLEQALGSQKDVTNLGSNSSLSRCESERVEGLNKCDRKGVGLESEVKKCVTVGKEKKVHQPTSSNVIAVAIAAQMDGEEKDDVETNFSDTCDEVISGVSEAITGTDADRESCLFNESRTDLQQGCVANGKDRISKRASADSVNFSSSVNKCMKSQPKNFKKKHLRKQKKDTVNIESNCIITMQKTYSSQEAKRRSASEDVIEQKVSPKYHKHLSLSIHREIDWKNIGSEENVPHGNQEKKLASKENLVCEECSKSFSGRQEYKRHRKLHTCYCDICDKQISTPCAFKDHMKTHTGSKPFKCSHCPIAFARKFDLKLHTERHDPERRKTNVCDVCGAQFYRVYELKRHRNIHTADKVHTCCHCNKSFSSSWAINTHLASHLGKKSFVCELCGTTFTHRTNLDNHLKKHRNERSHVCSICGAKFLRKSYLDNHTKIHTGERGFSCDQCGKAFPVKWSLQRHQLIHTGRKPYVCDHCGMSFTWQSGLKTHLQSHHTADPTASKDKDRIDEEHCFLNISDQNPLKDTYHRSRRHSWTGNDGNLPPTDHETSMENYQQHLQTNYQYSQIEAAQVRPLSQNGVTHPGKVIRIEHKEERGEGRKQQPSVTLSGDSIPLPASNHKGENFLQKHSTRQALQTWSTEPEAHQQQVPSSQLYKHQSSVDAHSHMTGVRECTTGVRESHLWPGEETTAHQYFSREPLATSFQSQYHQDGCSDPQPTLSQSTSRPTQRRGQTTCTSTNLMQMGHSGNRRCHCHQHQVGSASYHIEENRTMNVERSSSTLQDEMALVYKQREESSYPSVNSVTVSYHNSATQHSSTHSFAHDYSLYQNSELPSVSDHPPNEQSHRGDDQNHSQSHLQFARCAQPVSRVTRGNQTNAGAQQFIHNGVEAQDYQTYTDLNCQSLSRGHPVPLTSHYSQSQGMSTQQKSTRDFNN